MISPLSFPTETTKLPSGAIIELSDGDDFQPDKRFVDVKKLAADKRKQAK